MHPIDWIILIGTLVGITAYGVMKTRGNHDMQTYLLGKKELKWWTIGLSIMATQASAITFLSTTGQGYEDGMRFAQFYFGLPIAMVILSIFFLPIFYKLNVLTAYQYLEDRFDLRTRSFTAFLFLLQRGMSAGLTIYAPAIVLSVILGWDLMLTNFLLGIFVIIYTVFGGGDAVSVTQQQQMVIILVGMLVAFGIMVYKLPPELSFVDAVSVAGKLGKTQAVDFTFDLGNRYTFWSGILGGTFLFLSYFGTDQSQVQRYLSGKTLTESKLGLLFNGMIKIPMQVLVLFVGVMMFIFYQYNPSPVHFNPDNLEKIKTPQYQTALTNLENQQNTIFEAKKAALSHLVKSIHEQNPLDIEVAKAEVKAFQLQDKQIRDSVKSLIHLADSKADTKDTDYVFISFIMHNLPIGLIGFLIAVIFSAAMSSTSSEINALATATVVDFYKRQWYPEKTDAHYMRVSQYLTAFWGLIAMCFGIFAALLDNLIEAVNIVGSLFYGAILGIFMVAFFMKNIGSKAVFKAALLAEALVIAFFIMDKIGIYKMAYLWLNLVGCVLVMILAYLFEKIKF